jgi:general secretion pathway protein L
VGVPFALQSWELARADSVVAALTQEAREASALRRAIELNSSASRFIAKKRGAGVGALKALALTTKALGDDTYLNSLTLRDGKLTFAGTSKSASGLVASLASSPLFKDPAFAAPVLQGDSDGLETFTISVTPLPAPRS